ncbi:MAG: hypothetical protein E7A48_01300 [Lactobacillus paragasseri]|nr:hypothetical protein [Lactobacillus paragasseri]
MKLVYDLVQQTLHYPVHQHRFPQCYPRSHSLGIIGVTYQLAA